MKNRFKNIFLKESYGDLVYKQRRVKTTANVVSSKIVKHLRHQKYDPDRVLGPSTALFGSFLLKHCTLTNTTVGTL